MRNKEKLLAIYIVFLFIITFGLSLVSGVISTLPEPAKTGECVNLVQNDNVTSEVLISIVKPNEIAYINSYMTKNGTFFNYTFCDNDVPGWYTVNGQDNTGEPWAYDYQVNAQGKNYTSTDGLVYIAILVILVGIFFFGLYFSLTLEYQNKTNSDNELIQINWKKYLKVFTIAMTYVLFVSIAFISWNISHGILEFDTLANVFYWLFRTSFIGLFLVIPLFFVLSLVSFIRDNKLQKMLEEGLTVVDE